jgi:hypothetical protein
MAAAFWPGASLPLRLGLRFALDGGPPGPPEPATLGLNGGFKGLLLQSAALSARAGCRLFRFEKGEAEAELVVSIGSPPDGAGPAPQRGRPRGSTGGGKGGGGAAATPPSAPAAPPGEAPLPEPSGPDDLGAAVDGFTRALLAAGGADPGLRRAGFRALVAVRRGGAARRRDFVEVDYRMLARAWAAGDAAAVAELIRAFAEGEAAAGAGGEASAGCGGGAGPGGGGGGGGGGGADAGGGGSGGSGAADAGGGGLVFKGE